MTPVHRSVALCAFALLALGCGDEPARAPASRDARSAGTVAMAARLAAIADDPLAAPEGAGPAGTRARAFAAWRPGLTVELEQQLAANTDPLQDLVLRHRLATQLLREGKSERALAELDRLGERVMSLPATIPAAQRTALMASLLHSVGVAALRLGEQENCIAAHTAESCLFPVRAAGVHGEQRGSRRAIEAFTAKLEIVPSSLDARWLLNLAAMTVGEYPQGVPDRYRLAPNLFASEFPLPRFAEVASGAGVDVTGLAGGVVVEDFDLDGRLDIAASSWGLRDPLRLFRNTGRGFEDRSSAAGLDGLTGGINLIHGDYDNDGYPDLYVLRGGWLGEAGRHPDSLLRNRGDGTFDDVTEAAGLLAFDGSHSAAFADYDGDGDLDLFVGNETWDRAHPHPCRLYRNDGDGTFSDVAPAAGVDVLGPVKGVTFGDHDNDGWPDLYVSVFGDANRLYRNVPGVDGGRRFDDVTAGAGVAEPRFGFPTWFFDYDNDGFEDLFVAGWDGAPVAAVPAYYLGIGQGAAVPVLYRNRGDGTFENVAPAVGLDRALLVMGANFGDVDGDGWLDVYLGTGAPELDSLLPNRMFRNAAGRAFEDVTTAGGFGHLQKGHGVAFGDLDNDGDEDLYAVMGGWYPGDGYMNALFENPGHGNRHLTVRLVGARSNRFGVGARLRVAVDTPGGPREIRRTVGTGGSFGSSSLQQEIGLGAATRVRLLEVRWPGAGATQSFGEVPLDAIVIVREGRADLERVVPPAGTLAGDGRHGH